jgi:hypothetical protein
MNTLHGFTTVAANGLVIYLFAIAKCMDCPGQKMHLTVKSLLFMWWHYKYVFCDLVCIVNFPVTIINALSKLVHSQKWVQSGLGYYLALAFTKIL